MWRKADTKSDFRDGYARKRDPGAPVVDEDAADVTLSGLRGGVHVLCNPEGDKGHGPSWTLLVFVPNP
jgi:hypothetical protein